MDSNRRASRTLIDPKVRQVGFFTPRGPPDRTQSYPIEPTSAPPSSPPPPPSNISPSGSNSLSPVMIPPPRHASDSFALSSRPIPFPSVSISHLRRPSATGGDNNNNNNNNTSTMYASSYNGSEFFPDMSPTTHTTTGAAASVKADNGAFLSPAWPGRKGAEFAKIGSSLPNAGFDHSGIKHVAASPLTTVSVVNMPLGLSEKARGASVEMHNEQPAVAKPVKDKMSKAERRALQESQRAAKAAAKDGATSGVATSANTKPAKSAKPPPQKKDSASVALSEKKVSDRPQDKDRKKDVPQPRMQFDDRSRVEKAKRRAVVKQTEARNRVELFRHLPQYEHGTQLPDLESKFFHLDPMHPAVYKVGLQYLAGDISGGNARCIAMLQAFQEAIKDYSTPLEKTLVRDLTTKIGSFVSFLIECRPLSISMGNAIRFLKNRITKLPLTVSESEAKSTLQSEIERFINEKIILADKVIVKHAVTKVRNGDILLTYGSSSAVEMLLVHAHELNKQFRVVIVDSRPKLEGQLLLRRLVRKGISCTYTHINAVSYVMHEVTRVFLGASSILSNGTVYSRVGTATVAMVAHAFRVPVLVCCEAYKFHERVQLDSICSNELGNPDVISKVQGREEINCLDDWANCENLQLLNLNYDATPSDYVSMIITDYGMVPPTSVPVIVREYQGEHLWI